MQALATIIETIPSGAWWAFAGTFVAVHLFAGFPSVRQRYYQWRLDRRMQDPGGMMAWEYAEYERAIGDNPEMFDWPKAMQASVAVGGYVAGSIWIAALGYDGWQQLAGLALVFLGALYILWRRINDPDEAPLEFKAPRAEIPREAILGFVGAIFFIALIVLLIIYAAPI